MRLKISTTQYNDHIDIWMWEGKKVALTAISLINKHDLSSIRHDLHAKIDFLINKLMEQRGL